MAGDRLELPGVEFPCDFAVKAIGPADGGLEGEVVAVVRRHAPDLGEGAVRTRPSAGGRYLAVTVRLRARSREQLERIYRELHALDSVLMVL